MDLQIRFSFREHPNDPHVDLRDHLLHADEWYSEPEHVHPMVIGAADILGRVPDILDELAIVGITIAQLDRALTADEFVALGRALGRPIPEHHEAVRPFVRNEFILDIETRLPPDVGEELQPFAEMPITLHTEGSLRPLGEQPRFLVFQCLVPPTQNAGGQTIILATEGVACQLSNRAALMLRGLRYRNPGLVPILFSMGDGKPSFSFRDFAREAVEFQFEAGWGTVDDACTAIRELLHAMYACSRVRGIHWRRNELLVIDNRRFFHGRTHGKGWPRGAHRHLQRMRLLAQETGCSAS